MNDVSGAPSGTGSRPPDQAPAGLGAPRVDPSRGGWFCDRGGFWGTAKQLTLCAYCGRSEIKGPNEPRNFSGIGKPHFHWICDDCFVALPDEE